MEKKIEVRENMVSVREIHKYPKLFGIQNSNSLIKVSYFKDVLGLFSLQMKDIHIHPYTGRFWIQKENVYT